MRKRRTKSFENVECSTNVGKRKVFYLMIILYVVLTILTFLRLLKDFKTKLNDYSFEVQWQKSPESLTILGIISLFQSSAFFDYM